jgi:hypothetical protein
MLILFLLFALSYNAMRVLVPRGASLCVCDAYIKQALSVPLPESQHSLVRPVFIVKLWPRVVSLISTFIFRSFNIIQVSSLASKLVLESSGHSFLRLADCPTVDKRFVSNSARLESQTTQMSKFIRHVVMSDMHKASSLAR